MKKFIITLFLVSVLVSVFAQRRRSYGPRRTPIKWLSIAPRAGYGATLLFNSMVFKDPHIVGEKRSPANFLGGRFGFTHGDNFGISFVAGKSQTEQKYTAYDIGTIDSYSKSYEFSAFEYGARLRLTSDLGFIFEIGPQFIEVKSALSNTSSTTLLEPQSVDIMEHVTTKYKSIVLALGQSLFRSDRTELNLTFQASYAIDDLFSDNYLYIKDNKYNEQNTDFFDNYVSPAYVATHAFNIMATIEFNYFFAFWGDASCGKGRFMMFK